MSEKLTSELLSNCQISNSDNLKSILFLGYVPPVNQMKLIGSKPKEQLMFPLELMYCPESHLVQISCEVSQKILFPPEYPYTSGTTKILRDNLRFVAFWRKISSTDFSVMSLAVVIVSSFSSNSITVLESLRS